MWFIFIVSVSQFVKHTLIHRFSNFFFCSHHSIPYLEELQQTERLSCQHYCRVWDLGMLDTVGDYFVNTIVTPYYACVSEIYFKQNYV
jgi:hypothetical protein